MGQMILNNFDRTIARCAIDYNMLYIAISLAGN